MKHRTKHTHAINVCDGVVEHTTALHEVRVHKIVRAVTVDAIEIHSKYIHQNQYMENSKFKKLVFHLENGND